MVFIQQQNEEHHITGFAEKLFHLLHIDTHHHILEDPQLELVRLVVQLPALSAVDEVHIPTHSLIRTSLALDRVLH